MTHTPTDAEQISRSADNYAKSKIPRLTLIKHWVNSEEYIAIMEAFIAGANQSFLTLSSREKTLVEESFVPGHFRCAKCSFYLISKTLYMKSGNVGANNKPTECLNGCGPMWRVSWRDHAKDLGERLDKASSQLTKLQSENARLISDYVDVENVINWCLSTYKGTASEIPLKALQELIKAQRAKENKCGLCLDGKPCNFEACPNDASEQEGQ